MVSSVSRRFLSLLLVLAVALSISFAQKKPVTPPKTEPPEPPQDIETLKTDTDLVTVPVIATSINGLYIGDLRQEEFAIAEDGVPHEIAFFGKVAAPFHVVLMLDTSASTKDNLRQIQNAAYAFVQQLQPADRVKIISFDDQVRDLNEFTSDRNILKDSINSARTGQGTKVYDAFELALNSIRAIRGRRAIVLFSDGMDWFSDSATFDGTLRNLDEEGVIVYPIRYDTRATTEALARQQADQMQIPTLPTRDVIRTPAPGTTPPTFPGGESVPTVGTQRRTGPMGLPLPEDIMRRRREVGREQRYPNPNDPNQIPGNIPDDRMPPENRVPDRRRIPGQTNPGGSTTTGRRTDPREESIMRQLDLAYATADKYLEALAQKSGGRLLRADTLAYLPEAFAQIAAELRTQYLLGYYPLKKERDQRYRRIKVTTTRKDVMIRARPGYLATGAK